MKDSLFRLLNLTTKVCRFITEIDNGQGGQVLLIMLIALALGSILIAPTLNYTSSSLKHQEVIETKALELYSADSGVARALVALSSGNTTPIQYPLNGRDVSVNMTDLGGGSWLIISKAVSPDGSSTVIYAGVSSKGSLKFILNNAITSYDVVGIKEGVSGNVTANGDVWIYPSGIVDGYVTTCGHVDNKGVVNGGVIACTIDNSGIINGPQNPDECNCPIESWPSAEYLSDYYADDVDMNSPQYPGGEIDLDGISQHVGPSYIDNNLSIVNDNDTSANLTLDGTLYITGQTEIGKHTKDFILNLNGQTIFIEDDTVGGGTACWIDQNCQIVGTGCIIAVGDIYISPKGDIADEDNFVFIFSIEGMVDMNPNGDFHGSIAGDVHVNQQPGNNIAWNSIGAEGGLNFPMEAGASGSTTEDMVIDGWDIR